MTKAEILRLIRDFAAADGGNIGLRRFLALSGIKEKQIIGVHWSKWNEAKNEAGLQAHAFAQAPLDLGAAVPPIAALVASLGRWPTEAEFRLAKRHDFGIPTVTVMRRLEADPSFMTRLAEFCAQRTELAHLENVVVDRARKRRAGAAPAVAVAGYVYMMRSGKRYKIGRTSSPTRRHREVRLDLPERTDLVHSIETDDPQGIEAYWHGRFAEKRIRDTEFFSLSAADVAAFRKRKFQ